MRHSILPFRALSTAFALLVAVATTTAATMQNPVLYWNEQALNAIRISRTPPPLAALHLATLHVAVFDTVNSVDRRHHGWLVNDPTPATIDLSAAIAAAAHTVIDARWDQVASEALFKRAYTDALAAIPDSPAKTAGIAWGTEVAQRILAARADSGWNRPIPGQYASDQPGLWRETPPQFRPALLPHIRFVKPFAMTSPDQFRAPPPYEVTSREHAEELAYINRVGIRDGAERTEYETLSGPFWSDDLGTATPPGHWNVIAADLARRNNLDTPATARLFALLNIAHADAGISCWDTKYHYSTWRPENGIRELGPDLNPHAQPNPDFIPLMASPPFPDYTSGHSTFSSAGSRILERFFGTDEISFTTTSDGLPGVVRSFTRLSDARYEVGMSRVWAGIHVMSANIEGQNAGLAIADHTFAHALRPRE